MSFIADKFLAAFKRFVFGLTDTGTNPVITSGPGVPATTEASGSVFLRDNAPDPNNLLYVRQGGIWTPLGAGGGPGVFNINRVDCSVNGGRVDQPYGSTSFLHTQTAGNVVGGFNGGGTGNKSILGYRTASGLLLSAWSGFEYTWKSLAISTAPFFVYANMVVELTPGLYKIFVVDPSVAPPYGLIPVCTTVLNGDGSSTTTHTAVENVQVVGDLPPIPFVPFVGPAGPWQSHSYTIASIITAYPGARFLEVASGDGGLPNLQTTPAFMLVTGDSVTNAIAAFSVAGVKFNGVVV